MRKIFTLLLAAAFAISAEAGHDVQFLSLNPQGLKSHQKTEILKKAAQPKEDTMTRSAQKQTYLDKVKANRAANLLAGDAQTIVLTVDSIYPINFGDPDWPNWLLQVFSRDSDGNEYYSQFDIYPSEYSWVGTFQTMDYSIDSYSSTINNYSTSLVDYDESLDNNSTITISKDETPERYSIAATLYAEDGNTYTMQGSNLFFPDPKTYEMTGIKLQYMDYGTDMYGQLYTLDNAFFQFDILYDEENPFEYGKTYTYDDMDYNYVAAYWKHQQIYITDATIVWTKGENDTDIIKAYFKDDNENVYNIDYVTPKEPESYVEASLTADGAEVTDMTQTDGIYQFLGTTGDGEWNLSVCAFSDQLIGEVAPEMVYPDFTYIGMADLTIPLSLDYVKVDKVKVVAGPAEGDYILTADFYCYNGYLYHVTINHIRPEVAKTVNIKASNLKIDLYDDGWGDKFYAAVASTPEYKIGITLPEMKESYARGETHTSAADRTGDEAVLIDVYETDAIAISYATDGSPLLKGSFIAKDGTLYNLDFSYVPPTATRKVALTADFAQSKVRPDKDENATVFTLSSEDGNTIAQLWLNTLDIEGEFTEKDFDKFNTYVTEDATSYWDAKYFDIESASFTIRLSTDADGWKIANISGTMLCIGEEDEFDIPEYSITGSARIKDGLENDEEDKNFIANYALDEVSLVDKASEEGWILLQAKNADNQSIAIVFFAEASDPQTTIPAGEYTFDTTQEPWTVFASPGMDGYNLQASFAAYTNVLGFVEGSPWFMETGKIVVGKNANNELTVSVAAKNSYNRDILIGINTDTPTGIIDVIAKDGRMNTVKVFENGRIVIKQNGRKFDARGMEIR